MHTPANRGPLCADLILTGACEQTLPDTFGLRPYVAVSGEWNLRGSVKALARFVLRLGRRRRSVKGFVPVSRSENFTLGQYFGGLNQRGPNGIYERHTDVHI